MEIKENGFIKNQKTANLPIKKKKKKKKKEANCKSLQGRVLNKENERLPNEKERRRLKNRSNMRNPESIFFALFLWH